MTKPKTVTINPKDRITEVNSEHNGSPRAAGKDDALMSTVTSNFNVQPHYKLGSKKESLSTRGYGVGFASKADRFNKGADLLLSKKDQACYASSIVMMQIAPS